MQEKMRSYEEIKKIWDDFKKNIKFNNRYFVGNEILDILERFYDKESNARQMIVTFSNLKPIYYRARIGNFKNNKDEEKNKDREMLAPPIGKACAGRCNPEGISYLYLADNLATAIAEIKPNKGDVVTVAKIRAENISWFNFGYYATDDEVTRKFMQVKDEELINLVKIINDDFKSVVTVDDKLSYLPFQYITEYLKSRDEKKNRVKIDGFMYDSTLGKGFNYVIFNWNENIEIVDKYLYTIENLKYKIGKLED